MGALDGKVALITGAGSGIGKATAERLTAAGAAVFVVDRDEAGGSAVAESVGGAFHPADVGEAAEVDAAFAACQDRFGGVDIAFLNAGIAIGHADLATLPDDLYRVDHAGQRRSDRLRRPGRDPGDDHPGRRGHRRHLVAGRDHPVPAGSGLRPHQARGRRADPQRRTDARGSEHHGEHREPGHDRHQHHHRGRQAHVVGRGVPLMPASQIAEAVLQIVTTGRTGECWVCQPGRDAEPYRFHEVPGPPRRGFAREGPARRARGQAGRVGPEPVRGAGMAPPILGV